ncbi:MAG: IclR family transcriptional regulator [Actinomycetia bacterium]|nr:IclR family transcriptional regulator [Actinomycetes bacterium]
MHFALLAGDRAVYVEKVEPEGAYKLASRVGMHIPLYCTAIGKAILPELTEEDVRSRVGEEPYATRTESTHTTWADLNADLRVIHERGYAIDDEENEKNVRCVAAPVHDSLARICGAVSVSALTFLFSMDDTKWAGELVHDAATAVSRALGAPMEPEELA